ncbi:unnamed protein product [Owenia fusiformis]|uniref:Carboxylic ester hydrolase n=1 Tax=Owenia fusiformis TaxID=6347 RepID=A0A8J1YCI2_OWEFU|nr:unnamed protein product [Owenia fusiformis]
MAVMFPIVCMLMELLCIQAMGLNVKTKFGMVKGITTGKANIWYGIPYAAPPVGELRWTDPQPPNPWNSVLNCSTPGVGCPQTCMLGGDFCPTKTSEDCLQLNVFAPLKQSHLLPVMVFIHGGAFFCGMGPCKAFNGETMVNSTGVILVTINYRLGALGFMVYGSGLGAASGNYGLKDQILALEWVQHNIANFGGDRYQVTLFGQSAGAQSVGLHLMIPQSGSLFQKAAILSNPLGIPIQSTESAKTIANAPVFILKCENPEAPDKVMPCLRSKTAKEIVDAQITFGDTIAFRSASYVRKSPNYFQWEELWTPVIDNDLILEQPLVAFREGRFDTTKSLIIGNVKDEGNLFVYYAITDKINVLEYEAAMKLAFPRHFLNVNEKYPPSVINDDNREQVSQIITDYNFICPTRNATRSIVSIQSNIYMYLFDHGETVNPSDGCEHKSCHGDELEYTFKSVTFNSYEENALSSTMLTYWTNFAKTGDPNTGYNEDLKNLNLSKWSKYNQENNWPFMHFKTPESSLETDYDSVKCNFWDNVGYPLNISDWPI